MKIVSIKDKIKFYSRVMVFSCLFVRLGSLSFQYFLYCLLSVSSQTVCIRYKGHSQYSEDKKPYIASTKRLIVSVWIIWISRIFECSYVCHLSYIIIVYQSFQLSYKILWNFDKTSMTVLSMTCVNGAEEWSLYGFLKTFTLNCLFCMTNKPFDSEGKPLKLNNFE